MGRQRQFRGRAVDGILLLDKPAGITSNDALQQVKRIYAAAKATGYRYVADLLGRSH